MCIDNFLGVVIFDVMVIIRLMVVDRLVVMEVGYEIIIIISSVSGMVIMEVEVEEDGGDEESGLGILDEVECVVVERGRVVFVFECVVGLYKDGVVDSVS